MIKGNETFAGSWTIYLIFYQHSKQRKAEKLALLVFKSDIWVLELHVIYARRYTSDCLFIDWCLGSKTISGAPIQYPKNACHSTEQDEGCELDSILWFSIAASSINHRCIPNTIRN